MTRRELEERCHIIEGSVRRRGLAPPEELESVRPGGEANPNRGFTGAVFWYGHLVAFLEREGNRDAQFQAADAAIMAALAEKPKRVALVQRHDENEPRFADCYPKSFVVLVDCHIRNRILEALAVRLQAVSECPAADFKPERAELADQLARELRYQYLMLCWIATSPGPGFPYEEQAEHPEPPAALEALDAWDLWRVAQGFWQVNAARLDMTQVLMRSQKKAAEDGAARPPWSVFFSLLGMELDTEPGRLMRDRSLMGLLATVRLSQYEDRGAKPKTGHPEQVV